jgi:hypothetical protein
MKGKGQEVACQLFPALVWPQLWLLCVSPLRRMWGTGRAPEKSKNVIKAWKIRAMKKGQKVVRLFSLEKKAQLIWRVTVGHWLFPISTSNRAPEKELMLSWRRFWAVKITNKEALKAHARNWERKGINVKLQSSSHAYLQREREGIRWSVFALFWKQANSLFCLKRFNFLVKFRN